MSLQYNLPEDERPTVRDLSKVEARKPPPLPARARKKTEKTLWDYLHYDHVDLMLDSWDGGRKA